MSGLGKTNPKIIPPLLLNMTEVELKYNANYVCSIEEGRDSRDAKGLMKTQKIHLQVLRADP